MAKGPAARPRFFAKRDALRRWLEKNHNDVDELWVGFHKRHTGRPSITWPELVDEILCFGWIDGLRKSIDEVSWMIRVTPRRAASKWSAVNIKRARELVKLGRMSPAGLEALGRLGSVKSADDAYEQQQNAAFSAAQEKRLRANEAAWEFFQAQPPYRRRFLTFWVISAKQEATRERRLAKLIELSSRGVRIDPMKPVS